MYAIPTVGNEVDAPWNHWSGGPVRVANPLKNMVKCACLPVVGRTVGTNLSRIRGIGDHKSPIMIGRGDSRSCNDDPHGGRSEHGKRRLTYSGLLSDILSSSLRVFEFLEVTPYADDVRLALFQKEAQTPDT